MLTKPQPQVEPETSPDSMPTALAWEFVEMLQETGEVTLRQWMKDNGAPKAALDLFDGLFMLSSYVEDARNGTVNEWHNLTILGNVQETVNAIAELGGQFHGPDSVSFRREVETHQLGR